MTEVPDAGETGEAVIKQIMMPSEWIVSVSAFSLTKVSGAYGGSGIFARSLHQMGR